MRVRRVARNDSEEVIHTRAISRSNPTPTNLKVTSEDKSGFQRRRSLTNEALDRGMAGNPAV